MNLGKLLAGTAQAERARDRRRSYPIHMYVGKNGAGKTLAAVYDTIPDLSSGRPCLSTVRLLDYDNYRPCDDPLCEDANHGAVGHMAAHPLYVPFTTWQQLLEWREGAVLMDEITGVADSNESAGLPVVAANKLAQLRRDDVTVRITGLNFIRANKRIREAVNAVTRCRSSWPVQTVAEDGSKRIWLQRRLARYDTYDAQSLPVDDHTEHAYEVADHLLTGRLWIPECEAIRAYDSLDKVLMVGTVTDSGRCAHCAGTRRTPECSCPDYQESKAERRPPARKARSAEDSGTASGFEAVSSGVPSQSTVRAGV